MQEPSYFIKLHFKLADGGTQQFGSFSIGHSKTFAEHLFESLAGTTMIDENTLLFIELVEERNALPFNIRIKANTLVELSENCKQITKELFKANHLSEI